MEAHVVLGNAGKVGVFVCSALHYNVSYFNLFRSSV